MKISKKLAIFGAGAAFAISTSGVYAHVVVKPGEVGVGAFQTYTVGVPNERGEGSTIRLRLVIPEGLEHVSPNVKPGWNIQTVHAEPEAMEDETATEESEHADAPVTEIIWSGGAIPVGRRDDFFFSAKAPANETSLIWKAYQTYSDGSVVSWELTPDQELPKDEKGNPDFSKVGPASVTKVVNDLAAKEEETKVMVQESKSNSNVQILAIIAIVMSAAALGMQVLKK